MLEPIWLASMDKLAGGGTRSLTLSRRLTVRFQPSQLYGGDHVCSLKRCAGTLFLPGGRTVQPHAERKQVNQALLDETAQIGLDVVKQLLMFTPILVY